jgi:hypothetical protein
MARSRKAPVLDTGNPTEGEGIERARQFFLEHEVRWAVTNSLLRALIRRVGMATGNHDKFVAQVFDDAAEATERTHDEVGGDPMIKEAILALIDQLGGYVKRDAPIIVSDRFANKGRKRPDTPSKS